MPRLTSILPEIARAEPVYYTAQNDNTGEDSVTDGRNYRDLREHIELLEDKGLLVTIDEPIDKDSEMHPLVRWQFRGGIAEPERKAFLFNNIINAKGKRYDIPVVVCALAASQAIYSAGMDAPVDEMGAKWSDALSNPIPPKLVENAPCQEVVLQGDDIDLSKLPIITCWPDDGGPYITLPLVITKDPESGIRNVGMYRMQSMDRNTTAMHWQRHKTGARHFELANRKGERLEVAVALGGRRGAAAVDGADPRRRDQVPVVRRDAGVGRRLHEELHAALRGLDRAGRRAEARVDGGAQGV